MKLNFDDNIGIICNNNSEWIECQTMLFNLGFIWNEQNINKENRNHIENDFNLFPIAICLHAPNAHDKFSIVYGEIPDFEILNFTLYQFNIIQRKEKLKKLITIEDNEL